MDSRMKCGRSVFAAVALFAFLTMSPAATAVTCEDGGTYEVNTSIADYFNYVRNDSTVNVVAGGDVAWWLEASDGGIVNIDGGSVATNTNGQLRAMTNGVVNIYSGTVGSLKVQQSGLATVYGDGFTQDGVPLDSAVTQIENTTGGNLEFTLEVLNGGGAVTMTIPVLLETDASLSLGWPQTAPEINVYPALLTHDFGDVVIGESAATPVQIFSIGTSDLTISDVTLMGDAAFSMSGPTPPLTAPVDLENPAAEYIVTLTAAVEGQVSATVQIVSDDEDEPVVEVTLTGTGVVPPAPEIEVVPESLEHDFGDVEIGQEAPYLVQIGNSGTADLVVTSLALDMAGSTDFSITAAPEVPFTVAPSESIVVDIEIAYTPTTEGYASTTLIIGSDDEDEPVVEVAFGGVGIVVEIPPEQQIQNILDFIDESVEDGTLIPYGPGNRPQRRLRALKRMIRSAGSLLDAGYPNWSIFVLCAAERKTDGYRCPPDFVVGEATAELNQMLNDLIDDLIEDYWN